MTKSRFRELDNENPFTHAVIPDDHLAALQECVTKRAEKVRSSPRYVQALAIIQESDRRRTAPTLGQWHAMVWPEDI
jgi:hypothetical protein